MKSEATPFSEFFANRLGKIYDCIRAIPEYIEVIWGWVQSSDNAAVIASRVTATPADLVEGSEWQDGPAYLWEDEQSWPIRTDIMGGPQDLPQEELRKQYRHMTFHQTEKKPDEP